ncbi:MULTISPECIES: SDR family NAD(P)-dependent oxidoreductase [unclassified Paraflavitalea]|uniref:SDR family NAD(P)-dependent oxidoreductase n=1 Tax=unclassified Paraflavitalea TaxID=2798305 RepID=UPI003D34D088
MAINLHNKAIVVIGGTTGMGQAAVKSFLEAGAKVLVVGLPDGTDYENGPHLQYILEDATNPHTAKMAVKSCVDSWGHFDGLFHVAGGSGRKWGDGPLHELSDEGWEQTLQLNLTSVMYSNRAAVQYWMQSGTHGSIVNMGSVLANHPYAPHFTTSAYAAAKAAIEGFSKSIAAYYAAHRIRVNVLSPGLIETPMSKRAAGDATIQALLKTKQPLSGSMGTVGDITGMATLLLSESASFITGQIIGVDGAWSIS